MKKYLVYILSILLLISSASASSTDLPFAVTAEEVVVAGTIENGGRVEIKNGNIVDMNEIYDGQVEAQIGGTNYTLTFWNVGALKKDTAWFYKTDYSDATLTLSHDFIKAKRNNKGDPKMLGEMFNTDEFYEFEDIDIPNVKGSSVTYKLKFSGGPQGTFTEVKPYVNKEQPLQGKIEEKGTKVSFNFTGKHRFFNNRSLDMPRSISGDPFGGWYVGVYDEEEVTPPCKDSGIRFSDYDGEVMIRPHADEDAWYGAELDMVLCVDDHIRTGDDSTCVLSLADMTTFIMKPESELILSQAGEQSKISLIGGKIRTNVKRMMKDGTMDVEMSQAVAGIKGTTFVVEETGDSSTLKVLEGEVAFTSKTTGKSEMVNAGEVMTATATGLGEKKALEKTQEETTREDIIIDGESTLRVSSKLPKNRAEALDTRNINQGEETEKRGGSFRRWLLAILLLGGGIYRWKKKKTAS